MADQMEADERLFAQWNDWPRVERSLALGLGKVLSHDVELLQDRTGERCIAHRLAGYLEREFEGWHVDCEFNRQGDSERITKRVRATVALPESRDGQGSVDVTPDIIVHRRRNGFNLIAIEVKPFDSCGLAKDRVKLEAYLKDEHLRYAFAALVVYQNGGTEFASIERVTVREDAP
jgi:hypothetical protein